MLLVLVKSLGFYVECFFLVFSLDFGGVEYGGFYFGGFYGRGGFWLRCLGR